MGVLGNQTPVHPCQGSRVYSADDLPAAEVFFARADAESDRRGAPRAGVAVEHPVAFGHPVAFESFARAYPDSASNRQGVPHVSALRAESRAMAAQVPLAPPFLPALPV